MSANIIISYDGTYNEDDAVALGRVFADAGASVSLAYVRHAPEAETSREILAQHEAETLLVRGSELLGDADTPRHVITDRSTPEGLSALAEQIGADMVVFCSDSHTAKGSIAVGNSAERLLDGGSVAVAIAPAGFAQSASAPQSVGVVGDGSAHASAEALGKRAWRRARDRRWSARRYPGRGLAPGGRGGPRLAQRRQREPDRDRDFPVLVVPRGRALVVPRHGRLHRLSR